MERDGPWIDLVHADMVSIHAPAWGATRLGQVVAHRALGFQSTRPHGARPGHRTPAACAATVSIHAPAWGATCRQVFYMRKLSVSIHAPAWGATGWRGRVGEEHQVSIHAPAWGATVRPMSVWLPPLFQSTRPHGARRGGLLRRVDRGKVSIHAPAWGATGAGAEAGAIHHRFQSTRPHGARLPLNSEALAALKFQSTRPHGARLCVFRGMSGPRDVSIHAPAWGATDNRGEYAEGRSVSIHAPAWGATRPRTGTPAARLVSIHAPAWGATCATDHGEQRRPVSIHAPAWGATPPAYAQRPSKGGFNPRARMGRDVLLSTVATT